MDEDFHFSLLDKNVNGSTDPRSLLPTLRAKYIFSDEAWEEMKLCAKRRVSSTDDIAIDPRVSFPGMRVHRSIPTAPNFIMGSSDSSNFTFSRINTNQLIQDDIPIGPISHPHQFEVSPKSPLFSLPPLEDYEVYSTIINEPNVTINPKSFGFIPDSFWPEGSFSVRDLVFDYFRSPCGPYSRFSHKLYNILLKVNTDPFFSMFFGTEWLNETVLFIDGPLLGYILGLDNYEKELFGPLGQLSSHGFVEQSEHDALCCVDRSQLENVDFRKTRIFVHNAGIFTKSASAEDILNARWIRKRYRSASLSNISPNQ